MRALLVTTVFVVSLSAAALAQDAQPLPAVETMDCEAMTAEMMVAGAQMNSQFDREGFAADNAAMQEDMERRRREATQSAAATAAVCAIPGAGMACAAASQAQAARAQEGMPETQARQDRQIERVQSSMAGIDQDRMIALSDRYEQLGCETPQ
jgi:hypothetical protein